MPKYVSLFSYDADAVARMVRHPADRAEAAAVAIENAGGRMERFYWMLGHYDGLVVYEMPDEAAAVAFGIAVAGSGRITRHETHQLVDAEGAWRAVEMAPTVISGYRPPGAPADWREGYDELGA